MKTLPTDVHGVLDYFVGVSLIVAPYPLGWSGFPALFVTLIGVFILVYSLLTRYEFSYARLIPMPEHLILDFLSGVILIASPLFLRPFLRAEIVPIGFGIFQIVVVAASQIRTSLPYDTRPQESRPQTSGRHHLLHS